MRQTCRLKTTRTAICVVLLTISGGVHAGSLTEFYQLAEQNDQTLQNARYVRDASIEVGPQALGALLPQLSAQANVRENQLKVLNINNNNLSTYRQGLDETYATHGYGLQLSLVIFDWGAFKKLAAADSAVAQAEVQYRAAQQDLITRFVTAYLTVLAAQDTLRVDLDAQAAYKQQFDVQDAKYKTGLAAVTDAKNAQASYDTASATVISDTVTLNSAKRALAVITGKPVDQVDSLREEIALVAPTPISIDSWVDTAQKDNYLVMAARYALESTRQQASAAFGARLPTVSALGSISRDYSSSTFGNDTQTSYIGVSLTMPLYHGGQVSSSIRQANAAVNQAQTQYELQLRTADQNARTHYEGVVSGIAGVKAANSAVASQQASVIATEVGFKVGTRSILDALTTRQALATAQKAASQARYTYLLSLIQLKADVSQLTVNDLTDLDRMTSGSSDKR